MHTLISVYIIHIIVSIHINIYTYLLIDVLGIISVIVEIMNIYIFLLLNVIGSVTTRHNVKA